MTPGKPGELWERLAADAAADDDPAVTRRAVQDDRARGLCAGRDDSRSGCMSRCLPSNSPCFLGCDSTVRWLDHVDQGLSSLIQQVLRRSAIAPCPAEVLSCQLSRLERGGRCLCTTAHTRGKSAWTTGESQICAVPRYQKERARTVTVRVLSRCRDPWEMRPKTCCPVTGWSYCVTTGSVAGVATGRPTDVPSAPPQSPEPVSRSRSARRAGTIGVAPTPRPGASPATSLARWVTRPSTWSQAQTGDGRRSRRSSPSGSLRSTSPDRALGCAGHGISPR